MVAEHDDEGSF